MQRLPRPRGRAVVALAAAALAVSLIVGSALGATGFIPVVFKDKPSPVRELTPAASPQFVAWAQNSAAHPNHDNVYAQSASGGPVTQVNVKNSQGLGGGIDGNRLVYQQIVNGQSDIRYYNLALHTHSNPPPGVNSTQDESLPTISGNWLLFTRYGKGTAEVLLFNLTTRSIRVLTTGPIAKTYVESGQVNGNWATFMSCNAAVTTCWVGRYDIAANTLTKISHPSSQMDSAPAIASDGTLYFDRSGKTCGSNAMIEELTTGGTLTDLHNMNPGNDVQTMRIGNDGTNDWLYYSQLSCAHPQTSANLFKAIVN